MECITSFRDSYSFLSNFYPCTIEYNGYSFKNVEAAFQAQKNLDFSKDFELLSAKEAKCLGKRVKLRSDWEQVKLKIMLDLLKIKFSNPELAAKLISTSGKLIVEENYWHDTYWGVFNGKGMNYLGRLLMAIREWKNGAYSENILDSLVDTLTE